jgi:predicted nucleic acid-binding protein
VTLVDTSVWVEHFRRKDARLSTLLEGGEVVGHPFVVGELACGNLNPRGEVLERMAELPQLAVAEHEEVLSLLEGRRLAGRGLGWVDVHLLAAAALSGARLRTRDVRLDRVARELGLVE